MFTLRRLLTNVKDKDKPEDRPGAVYKSIEMLRLPGHLYRWDRQKLNHATKRIQTSNNKKGDLNNNIAEHHLKTSHIIDWDSATCLTYSADYYQRITLERWFTNLEQTALNRCPPLPAPYKRLLTRKQ